MQHRTRAELDEALVHFRQSPSEGVVDQIVARPTPDERVVLAEAELDLERGLVGDCWLSRGCTKTADGLADPDAQLTLMNTRVVEFIAGDPDRWALAGDQIYLDMDLSEANVPPGTQLRIGDAVIEITPKPHTGCAKFRDRFGQPAAVWVNSDEGLVIKARGLNARVVDPGTFRVGDRVEKLV